MKKLTMALTAAMAAVFAVWADEEISMVEQEIAPITVPFGIRSYTPSNKDVVRVEKTSENALRITALKRGRCDLEVRGDMDMTQRFQIVVGDDTARVKQNLDRELERVPEVHTSIIGNSIRVDGEVKSIKKWNYLMKVLKGYPAVRNFAEFTPGDELLVKMKENLKQCGFDVTFDALSGEPKSWKANTVALSYNKVNRTMNVQAKVYTPEQEEMIKSCVARERNWIAVDKDNKDAKPTFDDEFQVRLNMQVFVAKPVVRISVAYMAIGESDIKKIGNTQANTGEGAMQITGIFDVLTDLVHGNGHSRRTASIGASLGVTTRFLAQNQISRVSDTGYTLLESWSPDGATFKSGGTRFVKTGGANAPGSTFVGNSDLKEIPYGFKIDAKGGMVSDDAMSLDFDFSLSTLLYVEQDDSYDRKEDNTKQKINCPIGRTTLVSGFMDMVDKRTPPSGLPFLRSTPILNWFVADSGKEVTDRRLVIMICPEIVDSTQEAKPDVDREINIRVQDQASKDTEQVEEERKAEKGFTGFWSWLNWFTF